MGDEGLRESGKVEPDRKVWTRHGSTRWINDAETLEKAKHYILEMQDGPGARRLYEGGGHGDGA